MRAARAPSKPAGFTLIEIMIAISIIALALVAVSIFQGKSLELVRETIDLTRATLLVQERMAAFESGLLSEEAEGDFEDQQAGMKWKKELTKMEELPLTRVVITISWPAGLDEKRLSLPYWIYNGNIR